MHRPTPGSNLSRSLPLFEASITTLGKAKNDEKVRRDHRERPPSISAILGKEDAAPRRVTLTAAALFAKSIALATESDFARAAAKPPMMQSPAPVVSTALTLSPGPTY